MKISIIVPVYNVGNKLYQCLDSIIHQTYQNIEIILVNDGSTDDSGRICEEYALKDGRVKVYHKQNEGVSRARNYGIINATGELLCFVDSDDMIYSSYLEDFEIHVDADLYMQGYIKRKDNQDLVQHDFKRCYRHDFFSVLSYSELNCIINSPCFKLFRRSIVQQNNIVFDHRTSYGEDHLFSLHYIIYCNSIHFTNAAGYIYRISETESLTQRSVPYKEISYYALTAKKFHDSLCSREDGQVFKPTVGMTLMTNYIRTLKYLCLSKYSYKDYKWIRESYISSLKDIDTNYLPMKYKFFRMITCSFYYPVLYPILKCIV